MQTSAEQHDCYGNPFLLQFADAVEIKAKIALKQEMQMEQFFQKIFDGYYSQVLEDSEIEAFLYPTQKTLAKAKRVFQELTEIVAILSFAPGGITMFGWHYESKNSNFIAAQVCVW